MQVRSRLDVIMLLRCSLLEFVPRTGQRFLSLSWDANDGEGLLWAPLCGALYSMQGKSSQLHHRHSFHINAMPADLAMLSEAQWAEGICS